MAPAGQETSGQHIKEGSKLPLNDITLYTISEGKPQSIPAKDIFSNKKVAVICLPGAFTPVCSSRHVPGYIEKEKELMSKGLDEVVVIAVNDPYVMSAWQRDFGAETKVRFLADQNQDFVKATALGCDLFGSTRLKRFSMLVEDGLIKKLNVESEANNLNVSSADHMLELLSQ